MENLKNLKFSILVLLFLSGCAGNESVSKKTFILDPAITYPEERYVLEAVPVIPVEIELLHNEN